MTSDLFGGRWDSTRTTTRKSQLIRGPRPRAADNARMRSSYCVRTTSPDHRHTSAGGDLLRCFASRTQGHQAELATSHLQMRHTTASACVRKNLTPARTQLPDTGAESCNARATGIALSKLLVGAWPGASPALGSVQLSCCVRYRLMQCVTAELRLPTQQRTNGREDGI